MLAAALGAGLVRFASARPTIETRFRRAAEPPPGRVNRAHFAQGPVVRVSSVEWGHRHHPGYLVDGHEHPTTTEKWASAPGDREPWAEVQLDAARDLDEVALELAGARENPEYTMRRYRIECFRGADRVFELSVGDNREPRPRHAVGCSRTDRVRVTFGTEPRTARDVVRVYELEVWGR